MPKLITISQSRYYPAGKDCSLVMVVLGTEHEPMEDHGVTQNGLISCTEFAVID